MIYIYIYLYTSTQNKHTTTNIQTKTHIDTEIGSQKLRHLHIPRHRYSLNEK